MPKPRAATAQDRAKQHNLPRAQRRALADKRGHLPPAALLQRQVEDYAEAFQALNSVI